MNGVLRDCFPKGIDLTAATATALPQIAVEVNQRPRRTLGWSRPADPFSTVAVLRVAHHAGDEPMHHSACSVVGGLEPYDAPGRDGRADPGSHHPRTGRLAAQSVRHPGRDRRVRPLRGRFQTAAGQAG